MSRIAVLMSVYKSEKALYLDRALHSVWSDQTRKPDEVVLVEDGPLGEDLRSVIDKWVRLLGDRLKVVVNETNLGLTKSLNKGIDVVTADYIARMDSDDISAPERFALQCDFLDRNPDIDVVGGALLEFDESNPRLNVRHYPLTPDQTKAYIVKASPLAHPTVMMRRRMFDEGLRYNERYRTSQDIALWYDVICSGRKIANLDVVTINFRRDGDVFKRRGREKAWNEFKIYMNGIYRLHGVLTLKYLYPVSRLMFRLLPVRFVKMIYGSGVRNRVLNHA